MMARTSATTIPFGPIDPTTARHLRKATLGSPIQSYTTYRRPPRKRWDNTRRHNTPTRQYSLVRKGLEVGILLRCRLWPLQFNGLGKAEETQRLASTNAVGRPSRTGLKYKRRNTLVQLKSHSHSMIIGKRAYSHRSHRRVSGQSCTLLPSEVRPARNRRTPPPPRAPKPFPASVCLDQTRPREDKDESNSAKLV